VCEDAEKSGSDLVTLGILKVDVGPLRAVWNKHGAVVWRRLGPIVEKELQLFQQKQAIRELQNLEKFDQMVEQTNSRRHIALVDVSPSIADPIIDAAATEERVELRELWAKLLSAAMDPERKGLVHQSVIAAVRQLDPLDAIILESMYREPLPQQTPIKAALFPRFLSVPREEVDVSVENLKTIGLINFSDVSAMHGVSALGILLMKAVVD